MMVPLLAHPCAKTWLIGQSTVNAIFAKSPRDAPRLRTYLDGACTLENFNVPQAADPLPGATHLTMYRDERLLEADIAAHRIAAKVKVLGYDLEAYVAPGNTTPPDQIANPVKYERLAIAAAHSGGYRLFTTLGFGVGVAADYYATTLPQVTASLLPGDAIDFQTQAGEGTANFAKMATKLAVTMKENAKPGVVSMLGIGVSPKGSKTVTQADIWSAYHDIGLKTPPFSGFWFNAAMQSPSCQGCSPSPDIAMAVAFFMAASI
jgi:hypothetical protein